MKKLDTGKPHIPVTLDDGLPEGGKVGYALRKNGHEDFDASWSPFGFIGLLTQPDISYHGTYITISNIKALVCNNMEYGGFLQDIEIASADVEIPLDNTLYYILVRWTPEEFQVASTSSEELLLQATNAPMFKVIRTGPVWHTFEFNKLALGLPNKIQNRLELVEGYRRQTGLGLATNGLQLSVGSGIVWYGASRKEVFTVEFGDNLTQYHWNGISWQPTIRQILNNTQYQGPSGLLTLGNNRYTINWLWRGVESQKHVYVLLGTSNYLDGELAGAIRPNPPDWVRQHAMYIGYVIYHQGVETPYRIVNAFDVVVGGSNGSSSGVTDHNDLGGLQGGTTTERYHLTQEQADIVSRIVVSETEPVDAPEGTIWIQA